MKQRKTQSITSGESRIPPSCIPAEEVVLGALLLEKEAMEELGEILREEDFYLDSHRFIYRSILDLYHSRIPVDMLTVTEDLRKKGTLEEIGGAFYISQLTGKVCSTAHLREHAFIIRENALKRQVILVAARMMDSSYYHTEDIGDVLEQSSAGLDQLMDYLIGKSNGKHISAPVKEAMQDLHRRVELAKRNILSGMDTGLEDLNRLLNGWQPSELVVLAARPAMGKTALMLHFAKRAAQTGVPVVLFSLEMSDISLANRLILSESKVNPERFKSGIVSNHEMAAIEQAAQNLSALPIYVDDNPCVSMHYIRSRCKLLYKQGKCGLIMADYLQLAEGSKERNREQEVAGMSRMAKVIAKELSVPFILLSQLNRGNETRADKKPLLSDLRESGAIEQDADVVLFVHRPEYYGMKPTNKEGIEEINYGEIIVAKNRNGSTGTVRFRHNGCMTRFFDYNNNRTDK